MSERGIIHRDLATRNVLLGEHLAVRVADFGLSREAQGKDGSQYYRPQKQNLALPLRWTAPEVLAQLKWTTASDVYAYGVTLVEIFQFAEVPMAHLDDNAVLTLLARNTTQDIATELRSPPNMPRLMYVEIKIYK